MDCGSDHNALVAEVWLKLQKNPSGGTRNQLNITQKR